MSLLNGRMTYEELAEIIGKMTPEQQDSMIMIEDDDGCYYNCCVSVLSEDEEDNEGNKLKRNEQPYFNIPF